MGKTTVAGMLAQMGCAIHDSDVVVYDALQPKGEAFEIVALSFPKCWDKKKHIIKRDILADIVFNDKEQKQKLENILHPIVRRNQKIFIQKQKRLGRDIVVLDIPLLFETGAETRVDYTIVVSAPQHIQAQRVLSRPNMSKEKFEAILGHQMKDSEKRKRANFVIPTGIGLAHTYRKLSHILKEIKKG